MLPTRASLVPTTTRWMLRLIAALLITASVGAAALQGAPPSASMQEARAAAADTSEQDALSLATAERLATLYLGPPVWTANRRIAREVRESRSLHVTDEEAVWPTFFFGTTSGIWDSSRLQTLEAEEFGFGFDASFWRQRSVGESSDISVPSGSQP